MRVCQFHHARRLFLRGPLGTHPNRCVCYLAPLLCPFISLAADGFSYRIPYAHPVHLLVEVVLGHPTFSYLRTVFKLIPDKLAHQRYHLRPASVIAWAPRAVSQGKKVIYYTLRTSCRRE